MIALSAEQILQIHVLVVSETGGSVGLRDLHRLEAIAAAQTQNLFGKVVYESLQLKAAALIHGIITGHPFIDGNKRTAILCGLTFLKCNGITLIFKPSEIEDFAVKIVVNKLDREIIATWLTEHFI